MTTKLFYLLVFSQLFSLLLTTQPPSLWSTKNGQPDTRRWMLTKNSKLWIRALKNRLEGNNMAKSTSNKIVASDAWLPCSRLLLSWASISHNITFVRTVMSIHFLKITLTSCVHDVHQLILSWPSVCILYCGNNCSVASLQTWANVIVAVTESEGCQDSMSDLVLEDFGCHFKVWD